jgi:phage terminase small subunit
MATRTRGLSPSERKFADEFIKTNNATQAVRKVWGGQIAEATTRNKAHRLLTTNGDIRDYLEMNLGKAKKRVVQLIDSEREEIALKASESVIDRVEGKATQKIVTGDSEGNTLPIGSMNLLMARIYESGDAREGL